MNLVKFFVLALLWTAITSCQKQAGSVPNLVTSTSAHTTLAISPSGVTTTVENFETGTKGAYTDGTVTLSTGIWDLNDALLGNLSTDHKNGTQCVRIRNSGTVTMQFDLTGASSVTIRHAVFGSDGSSTWQLWASTNGGSTFSQVGSTVTTSSATLQTASFTLSVTGSVRFQVRKVSGGANRIDLDDLTVTSGSTGGGGGGGGKKFLFDATKAETAGNADWVIDEDNGTPGRTPTPLNRGLRPLRPRRSGRELFPVGVSPWSKPVTR